LTESDRLRRAIAAIDEANADDPNVIVARGETRPKELAHAELATEWVLALRPEAAETLRLAARAHHVRRWEIPRSAHPEGRAGYHRWRKALQAHHAKIIGAILADAGYGEDAIVRVKDIVCKRGLGRDEEVQTFEDALCLVFFETQLADLAGRLDEEKLLDVAQKTLRKMSDAAIARARDLPLAPAHRALLEQALR